MWERIPVSLDTMIGTPIAFGLTMIVCFTLFYYYWRIRQLRARLLSVQSAPAHDEFPVEFGIGKNVVETFPTIKACELKCTASEDLQCPICLVEYEEWEVLRQLPFCGHIFHTVCVGAWFEKQTTCPVCRMSMSELTESFEDILYRGPRSSDAAVVEVVTETPSWIRINRRLPLPAPPIPESTPAPDTANCTCHETATLPKMTPSSPEFHVVNIQQQQQQQQTCSKCKCTAKHVKTDDNALYSTTDVQILIFQTSVLEGSDPIRLDVERFVSEGVSKYKPQELFRTQQPQESKNVLGATQPIELQGAVSSTSSRCDRDEAKATEDVFESPQGSFEFQPILTDTGELTFRATTM